MATLLFKFVFLNNASPAVVLTSTELTGGAAPTVNISKTAFSDGAITTVVTGGALTYDALTKHWSYRLADADLASYEYVGMATTTYATASPASVHCLGIVLPDVLVSSRSALDAAGVRTAVGLASANLDTQLATLALEATLTAIKGAGWTTETLAALDALLDAIKAKTDLLPASPAAVGSAMTLADDAITAGKFDESTAFPLKSADIGSTQVARVGADGDTLETLSDQLDGVEPADVWTYATRTLTSTAAETTAAVSGSALTVTRHTTYSATLTGLTIPATWTKLWFSAKTAVTDADAVSIIQLLVSNPAAAGVDGLQYSEGAAATKSEGSLTVNQPAGTVAIVIADDATADLAARSGLTYDVKVLTAAGTTQVLTSGTLTIVGTPTQAIA